MLTPLSLAACMLPSPHAGIIKFRSWYHDCAGGSVPWPGALASQGLGPVLPRAVVMDRFSQHTQHCKSCSAAVKWIQRLQVTVEVHALQRHAALE